jgi:predicted metal-dependent peptidase
MCLSINVKSDDDIPTMCTDGKSILWSPSFVDTMDQEETVGVMAHEVLHIVFKHHLRRGVRDPEIWNIATDFAINQVLVDNGFTLPEGGLIDPEYKGLSAEAIFDRLPDDAKKKYAQGAAMGEVKDAKKDDGGDMSEAEVKQMEADIDTKVMMAASGAKAIGKLPSAIKSLIEEMERSQVDWRDVMRRFVGGDQPDDYSFRKPQKKMYHMTGIISPSIEKIGAGDVVVGIDTSGSVTRKELKFFLGEINAISEDIKPRSITVITCDAQIQTVRRYEQGEEIEKIEINGRGGTRVKPVFDYIEEHQLQVDNMVYLSDLEIWDYPENPPHYPTLWVSSYLGSKEAPWGDTTYLTT